MGSHRKWRSEAKKIRRKRIRQKLAQERDEVIRKEREYKEKSPKYQAWLSEQKALELFAEEEEARLSAEQNAAWLAEEARAQKAWRERQERLALARAERAKQELRIKEEWDEEQRKLKAANEEKERIAAEKQEKQEELLRQIENFLNEGGDMHPDVNVASVTNPDCAPCPFFTRTGACRFGDRCSRSHTRPAISRVLLVPNFYDHIGLRQMNPDELEAADDWLEYEDSETYHHFLEFYEDVLPEWERVGTISQFKVSCNFVPHLRGNVYIEYISAQDAVKAFKMFHGRFYGGKQINVEFVNINSWKSAICPQFLKQRCPKGRACNILHVFRNPRNAFSAADRDRQEWRRNLRRSQGQDLSTPSPHCGRDKAWSSSPESSSRRSPPLDLMNSSSHHPRSVRCHRSDRGRSSHRKRSRSRSRSRSRTKTRMRRHDFNRERNGGHKEKTRGDPKGSKGARRKDQMSVTTADRKDEKMSDRSRVAVVKVKSDSDRKSMAEENVTSKSSQPNEHIYFDSEGDGSLQKTDNTKIKDKKLKKRKKRGHRKEKRRKTGGHSRTGSSNSSDSSNSDK